MRAMKMVLWATVWAMCSWGGASATAQVQTFRIDSNGGSQVQFVSDATLEKITGVTSNVSGDIVVDPKSPQGAKATVKVQVDSIRTGIDLRDEHLCKDNWLDCRKYPHAQFVVTSVSGIEGLRPNQAVQATLTGKFTIHGVTREVTTQARVRWVPASPESKANKVQGDMLRIQASFDVKLEDHKVSIPAIVSLKVSPVVQVNVDLRATSK